MGPATQYHLDKKPRKSAKEEGRKAIEHGLFLLTLQRFRSP